GSVRIEADGRLRAELARCVSGRLQRERQRHGEATGVGGGDQLLRVGTPLVLEAGLERVGSLGQYTGVRGEVSTAGAAGTAPNGFCSADHERSSWFVAEVLRRWLGGVHHATRARARVPREELYRGRRGCRRLEGMRCNALATGRTRVPLSPGSLKPRRSPR